ncbi:MAG: hypothetical protein KatS3mg059_1412 [Thermomicrobiales bacterium]|nr:MAG: hypothetical protein KatS3mg059_1412 [Thermomicrobiales bacterium]
MLVCSFSCLLYLGGSLLLKAAGITATGAAMSALDTGEPEAILAAEAEAEIEALEEAEHHPVSELPPIAQAAIKSLTWGFRLGAALLVARSGRRGASRSESLGERTDPVRRNRGPRCSSMAKPAASSIWPS